MNFLDRLLQLQWFVEAIAWLIVASLVVVLFLLVAHQVEKPISAVLKFIKGEFSDLGYGKRSLGALNAKCIVALLFLLGLILSHDLLHILIGLVAKHVGLTQADVLAHSLNLQNFFYVFAVILVLSIWAVVHDSRKR